MKPTPQFAKLVDVDIRLAWQHEAYNFTPWLVENLDALGDALGIRLEAEGSEVSVESFSADILARNPLDDSKVLIENQLGRSDHSHLGQIMTYLAGLETRTIIWVATEFSPAHLSALKWLNEHTEEVYLFFAVKVKVVQIGDSPFAPVFEILERPNTWERQLHAVANGKRSERAEQRYSFWKAFVDRVPGEFEKGGPPQYTSNRWRIVTDPDLIISMYTAKDGVGIFIRRPHLATLEETDEMLCSKEAELTQLLGVPLGNSAYNRFTDNQQGDYTDPQQQPVLIDWLAEKADLYEKSVKQVFQEARFDSITQNG